MRALAIVVALTFSGCAAEHRRDQIRTGLLVQGLRQQDFLGVWGTPDRTHTEASAPEDKHLSVNQWGASYGGTTFEVWEYVKRSVSLVFNDGELTGWKTDKTVAELKEK